ncbi:MAG: hypothetical protein QNK03_01390 [Myxococcota bacterium]|nr:hypothetical protein [Myxococcota bacterium]
MATRILLLCLTLVVALPGWVVWQGRDAPRVDDADLQVVRHPTAPEQDARTHLELAVRALVWPSHPDEAAALQRWAHGGDGDPALAAPWLARNAATLLLLERALAAPRFQIPFLFLGDPDVHGTGSWTRLARLLALRSRVALEAGDGPGALRHALDTVQLGWRAERAEGALLVHALLGLEMRSEGLAALRQVVTRAPLAARETRRLVQQLERYRTTHAGWDAVWAAEYESMRAALEESFRDERPDGALARLGLGRYLLQPNRTLDGFAQAYRAVREDTQRACARMHSVAATAAGTDDETWSAWRAIAPNAVGRILLEAGAPDYGRYQLRRCAADTELSAVQALAALGAWQRDHGELPESLEALVPLYLDAVPPDAFDGRPLRFAAEQRRLYSVGDDFREAGDGSDEPAFSVRF